MKVKEKEKTGDPILNQKQRLNLLFKRLRRSVIWAIGKPTYSYKQQLNEFQNRTENLQETFCK